MLRKKTREDYWTNREDEIEGEKDLHRFEKIDISKEFSMDSKSKKDFTTTEYRIIELA